jgi:hypothetical protein
VNTSASSHAPQTELILRVLGDQSPDRLLWIGGTTSAPGRTVTPDELTSLTDGHFDAVVVGRDAMDSRPSDSAGNELLGAAVRVCGEGGTICVAASNLNWLPSQLSLRAAGGSGGLVRTALRKLRNPSARRIDDVKARHISPDGSSRIYAVKPGVLRYRLEQLGVRDLRVHEPGGSVLSAEALSSAEDPWLVYIGRT